MVLKTFNLKEKLFETRFRSGSLYLCFVILRLPGLLTYIWQLDYYYETKSNSITTSGWKSRSKHFDSNLSKCPPMTHHYPMINLKLLFSVHLVLCDRQLECNLRKYQSAAANFLSIACFDSLFICSYQSPFHLGHCDVWFLNFETVWWRHKNWTTRMEPVWWGQWLESFW